MTKQIAPPAPDHKAYFMQKLGISERLLERCLGEALSAGGDYADLYFESIASTSIGLDESLVKSANQGMSAGCGVRVVSGERTGYAYTDDLSADRLLRAARTAARRSRESATRATEPAERSGRCPTSCTTAARRSLAPSRWPGVRAQRKQNARRDASGIVTRRSSRPV